MIENVIQYRTVFSKTVFSITEHLSIIKNGREEERERGIFKNRKRLKRNNKKLKSIPYKYKIKLKISKKREGHTNTISNKKQSHNNRQ